MQMTMESIITVGAQKPVKVLRKCLVPDPDLRVLLINLTTPVKAALLLIPLVTTLTKLLLINAFEKIPLLKDPPVGTVLFAIVVLPTVVRFPMTTLLIGTPLLGPTNS